MHGVARRSALFAVALLLLLTAAVSAAPPAGLQDPPGLSALKYRLIGPAWGGRVSRVAGVPGNPSIYFAATASGGVWKSGTAGSRGARSSTTSRSPRSARSPSRLPIPTWSTSARARPTSAATWRRATASTSRPTRGKTWTPRLEAGRADRDHGRPSRRTRTSPSPPCSATPSVPIPSAASTAPPTAARRWKQVLKKDEDTGASDVALDPSNPNIVFAGLWQARRRPWEMTSGGPGSGLWVSRDGGDTWKQLTGNGLPEGIWGKVGVAVAPVGRPARLRADRGREGRPLPLGRRRRELDAGHRGPRAPPARLVLHDADGQSRPTPTRSGPRNVPHAQEHRRRPDLPATSAAPPRRPPRRVDRSDRIPGG